MAGLRSILPRPGKLLDSLLNVTQKLGLFRLATHLTPHALTVLNYHRIEDPLRPGFDTFKPNVSATPSEFARQMDYVRQNYNVITCEHLLEWMHGQRELPSHPLIITFDDGYLDNLEFAFPILRERNLPAIIFLTTGFMGTKVPFYWDYVSYLFCHTKSNSVSLPVGGETRSWKSVAEREKAMNFWIQQVKTLPDAEKMQSIEALASDLDVDIPEDHFDCLYLNWEQVRQMAAGNIEFGSHTVSHPILTRISGTQVDEELVQSKRKIEEEIGKPVIAFAYPNGMSADFSPTVMASLRRAGIELAFTLLPGPTFLGTAKKNPLAIRRIFLIYTDSFARFTAKLLGLNRWI